MAVGVSTPYHLDPKATYLVLCCVSVLSLTLLISIWHGDFSSVVALLGLVAIQLGSQDLLFLFGVLAPSSLIVDIFWLVERKGHHPAHGWLIFFTVCDMVCKVSGAVLAWSLYSSTSGEAQYSMAPNTADNQTRPAGSSFVPAPTHTFPQSSSQSMGDPFASYAPPRPDAHTGPTQDATTHQPFPTSQTPVHVL